LRPLVRARGESVYRRFGPRFVLAVVSGEIRDHRQRVSVFLAGHMRSYKLLCLVSRFALVARRRKSPPDVSGNAHHIGVVASRRAFVDEIRVRFEAPVWLLLRREPGLSAFDQARIYFVNARHVGELHQAVCGEDLISGRLAEPREPAARNFESYETLIAQRDKALG